MEDLVKLVEAVRLADIYDSQGESNRTPDSRIWAEGTGIQPVPCQDRAADGTALLPFAARTSDGFYVVDAERTK